MTTLSQQLGHTTTQTINGREWTLTRSTWAIQGKWSDWLSKRAQDAAHETAKKYREEMRPLQVELDDLRRRGQAELITDVERDGLNERGREVIRRISELERLAVEAVERWENKHAAGEYAYHSATVGSLAQRNIPGQFQLIWLCLLPNHPNITLEDVVKLHMPDGGSENFIDEWREFLLRSEGAIKKKEPS